MISIVLVGLGLFAIVCAVLFALWCAVKPKAAAPTSTSTPPATALANDPAKKTLLQTFVALERAGMTQAAAKLKALWTNDRAELTQAAIIEAEHALQGGPMAVVSDVENMFAKTLAAKLADSDEVQNVLSMIVGMLGPDHPALAEFAKSILPTKPNPLVPATASKT